ncbi:MAG: hypothetical protein BWY87_01119 [Deltaproteobacteria bacterium ADurb.Bin510]|nr:MAG: hypothetical protein BWY87_01119 [Deltaproteobacteria bacterium ADurb.Bin510]
MHGQIGQLSLGATEQLAHLPVDLERPALSQVEEHDAIVGHVEDGAVLLRGLLQGPVGGLELVIELLLPLEVGAQFVGRLLQHRGQAADFVRGRFDQAQAETVRAQTAGSLLEFDQRAQNQVVEAQEAGQDQHQRQQAGLRQEEQRETPELTAQIEVAQADQHRSDFLAIADNPALLYQKVVSEALVAAQVGDIGPDLPPAIADLAQKEAAVVVAYQDGVDMVFAHFEADGAVNLGLVDVPERIGQAVAQALDLLGGAALQTYDGLAAAADEEDALNQDDRGHDGYQQTRHDLEGDRTPHSRSSISFTLIIAANLNDGKRLLAERPGRTACAA